MGPAVEKLMGLATAENRFDLPHAEIAQTQIEAADERFQQRRGDIKLLGHRAEAGGVDRVADLAAVVPLLFAHTAYKSYPEAWLSERKWDRMGRWLQTVSSHPVTGVDLQGVRDIDDWIGRLEGAGHYVSCSSGTTGKSAMLNASRQDMDWTGRDSVLAHAWGTGITPARDRRMFGLAPIASVPRNLVIRAALAEAFGEPGETPFIYPVPPITIGSITGMVALRKAMADGTASPAEVAAFESLSAERAKAVDGAVGASAQALVEARRSKLYISGMWATLYKVAEAVRAMGYGARDFHPDNTIYIGGGLKGAVLPDDYREYIYDTLNLAPERVFQMYGMQEINSAMPRCRAGRYHVPPWLICLPLDEPGEALVPIRGDEEVEGRAAFFDLSLDGRWGGVISGDRIQVRFGRCDCGHQGPSIRDSIARYSELAGGDKISCSGTIDAYVRGVA